MLEQAAGRLILAVENSRKIAFVCEQGAPCIGMARCVFKSRRVRLIRIETRSKNCQYDGYYSGDDENIKLDISSNKRSTGLDPWKTGETAVEICNSNGWDVFAVEVCKYSIDICLTRRIK